MSNDMKRIQRVNQLIKEELSKILLREIEFPKDVLVTITRVETSVDLSQAKVWISVIPETKRETVLYTLNRKIYEIQQKINQKLKMRPVPRLKFVEEKQTAEAGRIEELLEKIKRNH